MAGRNGCPLIGDLGSSACRGDIEEDELPSTICVELFGLGLILGHDLWNQNTGVVA